MASTNFATVTSILFIIINVPLPVVLHNKLRLMEPKYVSKFEHEEVELYCNASKLLNTTESQLSLLNYTAKWTINGTTVHRINGEYIRYEHNNCTLRLPNVGQSDSGLYRCQISTKNRIVSCVFNVQISAHLIKTPPHITHPPTNYSVELGASITLTCNFTETNLATYSYWFKLPPDTDRNKTELFWSIYNNDGKHKGLLESFSIKGSDNQETLQIDDITHDKLGGYGCRVQNELGSDARISFITQTFRVESLQQVQTDDKLRIAIYLLLLACVSSIVYILLKFKMTNLSSANTKDIQTSDLKDAVSNWSPSVDTRLISIQSSMYDFLPYTGSTDCNFQPSLICNPFYGHVPMTIEYAGNKIEFINVLGKGDFGEVWKCIHHGSDSKRIVAVKRTIHREGFATKERLGLLSEIEIMKLLGKHPNVVQFHGCCTKEDMPIYLIMEFVEKGGLIDYLRKSRTYVNSNENYLTSRDLLRFSHDIARGMEFVSSQGIVHRDLAARNILLSATNTCKVADFGFARKINDECPYEKKSDDKVPVRWMAPESFPNKNIYTTKSDVFSFGILMWEIVTLGSTPYEKLTAGEVREKVCLGERLLRPQHCKEEMFSIMLDCWGSEPNERPTFDELAQRLDSLIKSADEYIDLEKYQEKHHCYYNILTNNPDEKL